MSGSHDDLRRLVDGHFTKSLSPANEAQMRAHLPGCADCRAAYASYQTAESLYPEAIAPRERLAVALGLPARVKWPRRHNLRWAVATVSVVGALALVLVVTSAGEVKHRMVARGTVAEKPEPAEVVVYRVKGERESMRVNDVVSPNDELAFAYRNEVGKDFLMIFGMDGAGHVAWYHPAWTDPANNPRALAITKQVGYRELPEAVSHPLQGPSLTVHALFMDKALDVRTVEARAARGEFVPNLEAGEILHTMVFEVRP